MISIQRSSPQLILLLLVFFELHLVQGFVFNTSSPSCGISSIPPDSKLPECAANASATIDEAISRAYLYAPVVHFHPLEKYYLQASFKHP